jgi:hypothetical protein
LIFTFIVTLKINELNYMHFIMSLMVKFGSIDHTPKIPECRK